MLFVILIMHAVIDQFLNIIFISGRMNKSTFFLSRSDDLQTFVVDRLQFYIANYNCVLFELFSRKTCLFKKIHFQHLKNKIKNEDFGVST